MVSSASALSSLMTVNTKGLVNINLEPLAGAMEKMMHTLQSVVEELGELRSQTKTLEIENAELKGQLDKRGQEIMALTKNVRGLEEKIAVVALLEKRLNALKDTCAQIETKLDVKIDRPEFERMTQKVDFLMQEASENRSVGKKDLLELKDFVLSESSKLSMEINRVTETRAPRSALLDQESRIEHVKTSLEELSNSMKKMMENSNNRFSDVEVTLTTKASIVEMNDKIGRVECSDLLRELSSKIASDFSKCERSVYDMREDIDCVLGLLLQNADLAAGMTKCLSCAKIIPKDMLPANGPTRPPNVDFVGFDGNIYKGDVNSNSVSVYTQEDGGLGTVNNAGSMKTTSSNTVTGGTVLDRLVVSSTPPPFVERSGRMRSPEKDPSRFGDRDNAASRSDTVMAGANAYTPHWPMSSGKPKGPSSVATSADSPITGPRVRARPKSATLK